MLSTTKSNILKRNNQPLKSKEVATKDLKVHRIRQEEKAIRRAKVYVLICLAMLCHVWDRMPTVDRLRSVHIKAASFNEEKIKEQSNSGIGMVLRKEASNIGFMHRKRFMSTEIQKDVTIRISRNTSKDTQLNYHYIKNPSLDKVYNALFYDGELLKYKQAYFATLLELFPSIYGYVSIVHEKKDSFHAFINSPEANKHKHKILASLFLLAEGVAVPLTVNKSRKITDLALKKANLQEDHFKVNMCESSKFVIGVINFFIENRENNVFKGKEHSSEPSQSREFINSPSFLIQTYIKHSLKNKKEMNLFAQTVYDMLIEYAFHDKEEMNMEEKRVLDRYIILPGEQLTKENKAYMFDTIETPLWNDYIDIGLDPIYLEPAMDVVPVGKNADKSNGFTDYGETALLGLFCAITYDCEKHIYTVDHMESASEELKSFFRKHKYMYGEVSKELHNEWNQVVGGLTNKNIKYMRSDRNQLVPGVINMMHVIKEIAGVGDTKKIDAFRGRLYEIAEIDDYSKIKSFYHKFKKSSDSTEQKLDSMDKKSEIETSITINKVELLKYTCAMEKLYQKKLKSAKSKEEKNKILQKLETILKIERKINTDIFQSTEIYINHQNYLKNELADDIEEYMAELIKKIAPSQNVIINMYLKYKHTSKEGFSDIAGKIGIFYNQSNEQNKVDPYAHPYCYECDISIKYHIETKKIEWNACFKMYSRNNMLEGTDPSIKKIVETNVNQIKKIIAFSESNSNPSTGINYTYLNSEWNSYIDTLLLEPRISSPECRTEFISKIQEYGLKPDFDSTQRPLFLLLENILKSTYITNGNYNNRIFTLNWHSSKKAYYSNIVIDSDKELDLAYFISMLIGLVKYNNIGLLFDEPCATIIADIITTFEKEFLYDVYYATPTFYDGTRCKKEKYLFIELLTKNGTSSEQICRISELLKKAEGGYKDESTGNLSYMFLKWMIAIIEESGESKWDYIIRACQDNMMSC
ncbi:hypothetical protein NEAUS03_2218 [Nematocida ausubeli]|nr:hypothetical protein NEAUS03_2218 [Nematocida ausubeli]